MTIAVDLDVKSQTITYAQVYLEKADSKKGGGAVCMRTCISARLRIYKTSRFASSANNNGASVLELQCNPSNFLSTKGNPCLMERVKRVLRK